MHNGHCDMLGLGFRVNHNPNPNFRVHAAYYLLYSVFSILQTPLRVHICVGAQTAAVHPPMLYHEIIQSLMQVIHCKLCQRRNSQVHKIHPGAHTPLVLVGFPESAPLKILDLPLYSNR